MGKALVEGARLLFGWCLVWVVVAVLVRLLAPDPATQLAGPLRDEATRRLFAQEFGLDRPLLVESVDRAIRMLRGDWGVSWRTREPVREIVARPAVLSIVLAFAATIGSLAASCGIVAFRRTHGQRQKWRFDSTLVWLFIAAVPAFVMGLWVTGSPLPDMLGLPRQGFRSTGLPLWKSLVLPTSCLALAGVGIGLPRLLAAQAHIISADWYRAALAGGRSRFHALIIQGWPFLLAALGDAFAQVFVLSLTGAVAVEHVFSLPGLGTLVFDMVQLGDVPVLLAVVAITTFLTFGALAVRALCAWGLPAPLRPAAVSLGEVAG